MALNRRGIEDHSSKHAFRLKPDTIRWLKNNAKQRGYSAHSPYAQSLLGRAVPALQQRQRRGALETAAPASRAGKRTILLYLSDSLVQMYRLFAVQLGYKRYSDLIGEVLEKQLGAEQRRRRASATRSAAKPATKAGARSRSSTRRP